MAWLPLASVSVFLLFLLCKRTAAKLKEPGQRDPVFGIEAALKDSGLDRPHSTINRRVELVEQ